MHKGFSLIELLAVVMIIGILSSIALPQYTKAIERSRTAEPMYVWDHFKKMAISELSTRFSNANVCSSWLKDAGLKKVGTTYQSKNFTYTVSTCSASQVTLSVTRSKSAETLYTLTGTISKNGLVTRASNLTCTAGTLTKACGWF